MTTLSAVRDWARRIKRDSFAVVMAIRDPRTPWYAKALGAAVLAYAFSPIDLIPDFIPILGQLDDLLIVPLGLALVLRLIPAPVMEQARQTAAANLAKPTNWLGAMIIVLIWLTLAYLLISWLSQR